MSAPVRIAGLVRAVPRYLNPDLSLNQAAIQQAARCEAQGRVANNAHARRYLPAHGLSQVDALDFEDAFRRAVDRYTDIATGLQSAELHFRALGLA